MVCNMPAGIGDLEWREATSKAGGVSNPNRLWPVAVSGFDELLKRKTVQVPVSWCQATTEVWLPCIVSVCPLIHLSLGVTVSTLCYTLAWSITVHCAACNSRRITTAPCRSHG